MTYNVALVIGVQQSELVYIHIHLGFPWWLSGKEPACNAGDLGSILGSGRPAGKKKWLPTSVFLPGEFHGQRSLVSYRPWDHRVGHDWVTNTVMYCF